MQGPMRDVSQQRHVEGLLLPQGERQSPILAKPIVERCNGQTATVTPASRQLSFPPSLLRDGPLERGFMGQYRLWLQHREIDQLLRMQLKTQEKELARVDDQINLLTNKTLQA